LDLKKHAYPQDNEIDNKTGWLFATIARYLQDEGKVIFKKFGARSFYKSNKQAPQYTLQHNITSG